MSMIKWGKYDGGGLLPDWQQLNQFVLCDRRYEDKKGETIVSLQAQQVQILVWQEVAVNKKKKGKKKKIRPGCVGRVANSPMLSKQYTSYFITFDDERIETNGRWRTPLALIFHQLGEISCMFPGVLVSKAKQSRGKVNGAQELILFLMVLSSFIPFACAEQHQACSTMGEKHCHNVKRSIGLSFYFLLVAIFYFYLSNVEWLKLLTIHTQRRISRGATSHPDTHSTHVARNGCGPWWPSWLSGQREGCHVFQLTRVIVVVVLRYPQHEMTKACEETAWQFSILSLLWIGFIYTHNLALWEHWDKWTNGQWTMVFVCQWCCDWIEMCTIE